ncbi:MAG TPA: metallophosphoesterase [Gemmatimonadales bacterium]|nr:metallophosphoesterase [Gemmatimonadales bacterium]
MTDLTIVQLSDLHFGRDADLDQVRALESLIPTLGADAAVIAGDLTQRARHGEFQRALALVEHIQRSTPTLVIPGNHDVQWWRAVLPIGRARVRWAKDRRYFGEALAPVLDVPGAVISGALTSYGLSWGSLTWNLRDLTVKGHLPRRETKRLTRLFADAPPEAVRVAVLHHNVLPGAISRRMGMAHWRSAQRRLLATGADVVLCAHDHQEGAGQVDDVLPVSTSSTHTNRTRGGRPSAFNLVHVDAQAVHVQHWRWESGRREFIPSDINAFARRRRAPDPVPVSA